MTKKQPRSWRDFIAPRYWSTWLLLGLMRLLALLPFRVGLAVGAGLGWLLYHVSGRRRCITEVNIGHCFAELSEAERGDLVRQVFRDNGIGLIETSWAYWGNRERIRAITTFEGLELMDAALAEGRGVIALGAHFSTLDLGGLLYSFSGRPLHCIYRQHNNPLMDYMICTRRSEFCVPVERKQFRQIVQGLKKNATVWYAPDQDFGRRLSVYVPFFGRTAATITGTTKMVGFNQSPIVMLSHHRNLDNSGYTVRITAVADFPSGDEVEDARIVNRVIEREIRRAPSQYMWVHRRFKTQPEGRHQLYKSAGCY